MTMGMTKTVGKWLEGSEPAIVRDVGLLLARVFFGGLMLVAHGWGKLASFGDRAENFPDPLGIGSPLSLAGAVGAEVFAALAVVLGLATRLATLPLIFTMLVAGFIVHADDPFRQKELAIMYLAGYLVLLFTGPGRLSLDALIAKKLK